jgi:hypothetical protein
MIITAIVKRKLPSWNKQLDRDGIARAADAVRAVNEAMCEKDTLEIEEKVAQQRPPGH